MENNLGTVQFLHTHAQFFLCSDEMRRAILNSPTTKIFHDLTKFFSISNSSFFVLAILVESIGFMDALSASAVPSKKDPKKRKRLLSGKRDEPESPKIETKPLKFYKDTLEEADDDQTSGEKSPTKEIEASMAKKAGSKSPESVKSNSTEQKTEESPEIEEPEEKRGPGIGCGPDGPHGVLVSPNMPRRKKRPIRWRPDEELTEIRFFELDETERTNVTKTSFTEQKQMEHTNEKNAFQLGRKMQSDDTMAEQTTWRSLIIVDNVPDNVNFGCKSREAKIQADREKTVLQEIFFRHSINDSPHEPDHEVYEHVEPQIIPLEDITGNDSITNFTDIQWPQPKGELPAAFSSNAFMNVFSGITIPSVLSIPPVVGISNPLANFPLGVPNHITREPQAPMWMVPPAPFMQQPPPMIPQQLPNLQNRAPINNNYRSNMINNNRSNINGGNWVRGNSRRGTCNQFKRSGFCRNKNCPYIHER